MIKKILLLTLAISMTDTYLNGAALSKLSLPRIAALTVKQQQTPFLIPNQSRFVSSSSLLQNFTNDLQRNTQSTQSSQAYLPSDIMDEQYGFKTKIENVMRTLLIEIGRQKRPYFGFAQAILTIDKFFNIGAINSRYDGDLDNMRPGTTALTTAANNDQTEYVKLLLENGAHINTINPWNNYTPLMYAARNGNIELVNFLINRGANIQATNSKGANALICAITDRQETHSNFAMIRTLLNAGISPNSADEDGPALWHAAEKNNYDVCKLLIAHGAHVNTQSKYGYSPLMSAIQHGKPDLMKLFLDADADVDLKSDIGRTAQSMAQDYHYFSEIKDEMLDLLNRTEKRSLEQSFALNSRVQYADFIDV